MAKNESTALALNEVATAMSLSSDQVSLIKRTIADGFTDDELTLFLWQAQRLGLDPLSRQIYAFKSKGRVSICAGIDGLRAKADETRCYAPGKRTEFGSDNGDLTATAYVMKRVQGETDDTWQWMEVEETAYLKEQNRGTPNWSSMPRIMLAKCAEARALRRAFPVQLGGMYAKEELDGLREAPPKAKNTDPFAPPLKPVEVEATVIPKDEPPPTGAKSAKAEVWESMQSLGLDVDDLKAALTEIGQPEDSRKWTGADVNTICAALEKRAGL